MQESKALHYILGVSLVMIAVFAVAALVLVNSQADSVGTSASINNTAPTVNSVFVSANQYGQTDTYAGGTINDLVAGGTKTIHINGVVEDANGNDDITTVQSVFYRTPVGGSCTPSNNDCYVVSSCDVSTAGVTALQKKYDCAIDLQYYTDSTSAGGEFAAENFTVKVTVIDASSATVADSGTTKEVQTLLALNIPGSVGYGSFALGSATTAGNNQEMVVTQAGNDMADVEVSMSAPNMVCDAIGVIARSNQQWSLTDLAYNAVGTTALSGTAADTDLDIPYRHGANPSKSLYWNIAIPSTGVKGACSGTTTISAIAH